MLSFSAGNFSASSASGFGQGATSFAMRFGQPATKPSAKTSVMPKARTVRQSARIGRLYQWAGGAAGAAGAGTGDTGAGPRVAGAAAPGLAGGAAAAGRVTRALENAVAIS